jgi:2-polyprenyl-3-methyl-5-hydroxy-6-metoxy-1,4-benzoquinol methylase
MASNADLVRPKREGYYANDRADLVAALPRPLGRVLDVGCGEAEVGRLLLAEGASSVTGVEINPNAAAAARDVITDVLNAPIEDALQGLSGPFDTICCYDVLEHLVEPGVVLESLRGLAARDARLHISIPNARHVSLIADLVFRGTFGYTEWGHRDRTHLRWFTKRDLVELVRGSGWTVHQVSHPALHRSRLLDRVSRGWSTEFLVGQWHLLAFAGA